MYTYTRCMPRRMHPEFVFQSHVCIYIYIYTRIYIYVCIHTHIHWHAHMYYIYTHGVHLGIASCVAMVPVGHLRHFLVIAPRVFVHAGIAVVCPRKAPGTALEAPASTL